MSTRIHLLLLLTLASTAAISQTPQQFSYQAVVRDNNNQLVANRTVGMRISMLKDSVNGQASYTETHTPKTNTQGIVQLNIGGGTVVSGTFASVPWSSGKLYVKTEMDLQGGTNYTTSGTTQMLSVPYSLYASDIPVSKSGDTVTIGKSRLIIPGSQLLPGSAPASLSNGLVAYYPFNGNANDESGNGNHGTLFGPAFISDKTGKANSAVNFNGVSDYIKVADNSSIQLSEASFSFWISYTSTNKMQIFQKINFLNATNANFSTEINDYSNLLSGMRVAGSYQSNCVKSAPVPILTSSFTANDNNWHHLTFVLEANKISLYLDGVLKNTLATTGKMNACPGSDLLIGRGWNDFPLWLNAKFDEFRIYNRAIKPDEITWLANN